MKKILVAVLTAVTVLGSSLTALAAPEQMPDGGVFDAEYYAQSNPDVAAALGTDRDALYQHYVMFGAREGRMPFAPGAQQPAENPAPSAGRVPAPTPEQVIWLSHYSAPPIILTGSRPVGDTLYKYTNGEWRQFDETVIYRYDAHGNLIVPGLVDGMKMPGLILAQHLGRKTDFFDAAGRLSDFEYDEQGRPIKYSTNDRLYYDEQGRLVSFDSFSFSYSYNEQGQLIRFDNGYQKTYDEYSYDEQGKLVKWTHGGVSKGKPYIYEDIFEYDASGNLISRTSYQDGKPVYQYEYLY